MYFGVNYISSIHKFTLRVILLRLQSIPELLKVATFLSCFISLIYPIMIIGDPDRVLLDLGLLFLLSGMPAYCQMVRIPNIWNYLSRERRVNDSI